MASYRNPDLREKLAAEYVLGTLTGRARSRFQSLMRYDPDLRRIVADWEERLVPLAHAAPEIAPPARLWRTLERRIRYTKRAPGWWENLAFWRTLAATTAAFLLILGIGIGVAPKPEPPMSTVAVMSDERGQPAMVVSWSAMERARDPHIRVRMLQEHPSMPPTASWELWVLPGGNAAPMSLGLVSLEPVQVMRLPPAVVEKMTGACGVAMSVEPPGGSPTGAPTGPVIFKGQCVKIL